MPNRTFGRGFLADKLYNAEDAVPAGAFELLQRRRKRRPLGWLLFPLTLLLAGGVFLGIRAYDLPEQMARGGEPVQPAFTLKGIAKVRPQTFNTVKAKQSMVPATAEGASGRSNSLTISPSVKEELEVASSSSESDRRALPDNLMDNGQTQMGSTKVEAEENTSPTYPGGETNTMPIAGKTDGLTTRITTNAAVAGRQSRQASSDREARRPKVGAILLASAVDGYAVGQPDREKASLEHSFQKSQSTNQSRQQPASSEEGVNGFSDEIPTAKQHTAKEIADRNALPTAMDGETLESRNTGLSVAAVPVTGDVALKPIVKPKKQLIAFKELHITLGAIILGQDAHTQSVAGQTAYSPTNTSAGIGLDAGVSTRLGLTNWLGLLAGVHSLLYNQTTSGIATDPNAKVIYTPTKTNTLEAQPVVTETSYGIKTWTWIPLMPQVMAELRLPAARWGIAAGVYAPLAPQTYATVEGSARSVHMFNPTRLVQPMAQFWADASRTRIALTVRRVQGNGLMPHPAASSSTGLFVSGTISYRLFK